MKIIQNIKYQYQLKSIEDLMINFKYNDVYSKLLKNCQNDPIAGFNLLKNFLPKILEITSEDKILNDNIILINTFEENEGNIILNFINFYLQKLNFSNFDMSNYQKEILLTISKIKNQKNIKQEDMFQNSICYQAILTFLKEGKFQFLNNQFAFFSTPLNINFTNIRLTKCYFLLIEHPYKVYQKYKNKLQSKDLAMNMFLNSDNDPLRYVFEDLELMVVRKDWATHTSSWSDPNVLNSLKGSILKKEEYMENPDEFFASVVLHLRQSGYEIPLNYKVISEYILNNTPEKDNEEVDISNHEKKALKKYIENISDELGYEL